VEEELDHEKFLDLLEEVEIHVIDMLIRILTRENPDRASRLKKLLNPLRTQVRAVRFGTPPDFEDGLVELRNRRLGSVILSYHQLVALMAQAKDGRHLTQLGNAEIRAAKKFRKLTRKDIPESEKLH
jgi:hypothetical protein